MYKFYMASRQLPQKQVASWLGLEPGLGSEFQEAIFLWRNCPTTNINAIIDVNKTRKQNGCDICDTFYIKALSLNQMSAMAVMMYWWCLWTLEILLL